MHVPKDGVPIQEFVRLIGEELVSHPEIRLDKTTAEAIAIDLAAIVNRDRDSNVTKREITRLSWPTDARRRFDRVLVQKHHVGHLDTAHVVRCLELPRGVLGPLLAGIQGNGRMLVGAALIGAGAVVAFVANDHVTAIRRDLAHLPVMAERIDRMSGTIEGMGSDIGSMSATIETMSSTMTRLAERIDRMAVNIERLTGTIDGMSQRMTNLSGDIRAMRTSIGALQTEIAGMGGHMEQLDKGINGSLGKMGQDIDRLTVEMSELRKLATGVSVEAVAQLDAALAELGAMRQSLQSLSGAAEILNTPKHIIEAKKRFFERLLGRN